MESSFRIGFTFLSSLVVWILLACFYVAKGTNWQEFRFVHTLIVPVILFVTLAPLSILSGVRYAKGQTFWFFGVWMITMIPVTYLVMRALTGFPPDYDLYSLAGGILPCFALFLSTRDIT